MSDATTRASSDERFWAKVQKTETCWLWTAAISPTGYGRFGVEGKNRLAHRVAYTWLVGPIPAGLQVDHKCHVKHCVNPKHMQLVTNQANSENRKGAHRDSSSGVRGVYWSKAQKKWAVTVCHNGRVQSGGYFRDLNEAAEAAIALRNATMKNNLLDRFA